MVLLLKEFPLAVFSANKLTYGLLCTELLRPSLCPTIPNRIYSIFPDTFVCPRLGNRNGKTRSLSIASRAAQLLFEIEEGLG